ncbi:MAG: lysozyme inhibitor LprI family protein [Sphingopyxis sp.]|uniref:lysozyme inhibitor LprI family protein n=1 Tax=Sphingopyxis sp. TaxID=1908224 RepID=UPI002ABC2FD9|nr:lysozyme inhibitor LprI family protein [Sphingopyxis sp.]MDZ3832411.1 lysozyme inhibitor LprI family protein [Sphingopyxis sp.]
MTAGAIAAILTLAAATATSGIASEQAAPLHMETPISEAYGDCIGASGGVTAAMRDCSAQEYARLDARLNASWRTTMARLSGEAAQAQLRRSQREWLRTRWAECDESVAKSGMAGGTGALLIYDSCQIRVLAQRIAWIENYRP